MARSTPRSRPSPARSPAARKGPRRGTVSTRGAAAPRRRVRRSTIAGTGGGRRNVGRGGPGGEARPSPGSSPPGTPDLRAGAEATVTTGPVSDAIERLQAEHREIAALLDQGPRALPRVAAALQRHAVQEEEVFYPALRQAAGREFAAVLTGALREHRGIDRLLDELAGLPAGAGRRERFDLLRSRIEEHVRQEETTVFPEALRRLSRPERLALGERMDLLSQGR